MIVGKVDHVGIAVEDITEAGRLYQLLGMALQVEETHQSEGVKIAFYGAGEGLVELLEPSVDSGPIAKYLETHGGGIHHVAIAVDNLEETLSDCEAEGREVAGGIRMGARGRRVAFLHPKCANGVLVELVEVEPT